MAIDFRLGRHSILGTKILEILIDGQVAGVVYPKGEQGIRLVSAHMTNQSVDADFAGEVELDDGSGSWPPIPSIQVDFDPSPYFIEGNRIIKLKPRAD